LLVEDEAPLRRLLRTTLIAQGYRTAEAASGQQALRVASEQPPDLVILDLGLPDMDGQQVLAELRKWLQAPIIILSARSQEMQKVAALDTGADDYVTKPFHMEELVARIRVALRHAARMTTEREGSTFVCGELRVDLAARRVLVRNAEVHLTPIEYKLLTALVQNAGRVLTHRHLLKEAWGPDHAQETHYLRVYMASLRRKIEADPARPRYLLTEQGVGYRLASE
jgi:two-component system KDP operon response regulator KdpE